MTVGIIAQAFFDGVCNCFRMLLNDTDVRGQKLRNFYSIIYFD